MTPLPTTLRDPIVEYALTLIGTPYLHQGRMPGPNGGIDCIGVGVLIARHFGWPHEDRTAYKRKPDGKLLVYLREQMDEIALEDAGPGDLVAFWFGKPGVPAHTAILSSYGMIHAQWLGKHAPNRVCEHVYSDSWRARAMAAFQFRTA